MDFVRTFVGLCLVFAVFLVTAEGVVIMSSERLNTRIGKGKGAEVVAEVSQRIGSSGVFPQDHKFLCRIAWVESKYGTNPRTYRPGYYGGIWQVDRIGYSDTKTRPSLKKYYPLIKREFGIDWTHTSWEDLIQPLYSGLAARLVLAAIPHAIPMDLLGQAEQWKKYYNTEAGAGTVEKFIEDVEKATGCAR